MISILIEAPVSTDLTTFEVSLQQFISSINGSWKWQGRELNGKRLIDCVYSGAFDWRYLLPVDERGELFNVGLNDQQASEAAMIESWVAGLGWRLVGVWKWDGVSVDRVVYDTTDRDNPIETSEIIRACKRLYPEQTSDPLTDALFIDVLNYMADEVQYATTLESSVEVSRERPGVAKEVHSWGWPART